VTEGTAMAGGPMEWAQQVKLSRPRCWDSATCEPLQWCHLNAKLHIFFIKECWVKRVS